MFMYVFQIFKFNDVMIMGADVNHPPAGEMDTSSLVAVVGSYDKHAAKYHESVRVQSTRKEMIMDLQEITK